MAKILARSEGSHELVGGAGGGKMSDTATAPVLTATSKGGDGKTTTDSGGDGAFVDEKPRVGGSGERDTSVEIVSGNNWGGKTPLAADRSIARDSGLAGHDSADHALWEGSEVRGDITPNSTQVAGAGAAAKASLRYDRQDEARREKGAFAPKTPSKGICGDDSGKVVGRGHDTPTPGVVKKATNTAGPNKKKKGGNGGMARSRPAKTDAAAVRIIRRRLEQAAACAAAVSFPTGTEQEKRGGKEKEEKENGWEDAVKEIWNVLLSMPLSSGGGSLSLEKLFGDGITAETLVGVTRGLRYACGLDSARFSSEGVQEGGEEASSNTERASQVRTCVFFGTCRETRELCLFYCFLCGVVVATPLLAGVLSPCGRQT